MILAGAIPLYRRPAGLPMRLVTFSQRRQPVLRRRQLIVPPRQKHALGVLACRHPHQRIQNTAIGVHQDHIAQLSDRFDGQRGGTVLWHGESAERAPARKAPAARRTPAARCAHTCATTEAGASPSAPPAAACVPADARGWPADAPRAEDGAAPGGRRSPGRRCGCPAERSAVPVRPRPSLSTRRPPRPASMRQNACQDRFPRSPFSGRRALKSARSERAKSDCKDSTADG